MNIVEAEFREGALHPLDRLQLRPGEHVRIIVVRCPDRSRWDLTRLALGSEEENLLARDGLAKWAEALDQEDRE